MSTDVTADASHPGEPASDSECVPSSVARESGATGSSTSPRVIEARRSGSLMRWWSAVGLGVIVSTPFAWLLSFAGMLPFFLGVFFFLLFGLLIGAAMHRVASAQRPYGRVALVAGTTIVVVFGWLLSIAIESRGFPHDMAVKAAGKTRYIGEQPVSEYRAAVAEDVRRFLRERYPPGGMFGYIRWILASGELRKGDILEVNRTLRPAQRRLMWAVRVVLSIALFAFGIGSQTFSLRLQRDPSHRVMDDKKLREKA